MRTIIASLLLAGCATISDRPDPNKPLLDEHEAKAESAPTAITPVAPAKSTGLASAKLPAGTIARSDLELFLNGSPGSFLQHVDSEPKFHGGRFHGWRVTAFFPGDTRFSAVDVRAGDVVLRVNGNSIERPEQLMQVWQDLRTSKELVVDLEREGAPRTLRWSIAP